MQSNCCFATQQPYNCGSGCAGVDVAALYVGQGDISLIHAYTRLYKSNEQAGRVTIIQFSVTIESESDSVRAMEEAIASALADQRSALIAGDATVSDATDHGQRTISYQPDLPVEGGRITRLVFLVEGRRITGREAQAEVEDWFLQTSMAGDSKVDVKVVHINVLGCSPSLLALLCFGVFVFFVSISIADDCQDEGVDCSENPRPAYVPPTSQCAALPPAQTTAPRNDCGRVVYEVPCQGCQQGQDTALCDNGCVHYPLRCDLQAIKGDIDKQSGRRWYYTQQHPHYTQILIESETGERWFCTAQAAERAGWVQAP